MKGRAPVKVLLLANNSPGLHIAEYLRAEGEEIVGLGIMPPDRQRYTEEIIEAAGVPADRIVLGETLRDAATLERIRAWAPDIIVLAFYGLILKPELLSIPPRGVINMHPALLPWNRGMNANVWPIIEGTPGGVTIHYLDPDIDTGDIIAQREVPVLPTDTGGSHYEATIVAIEDLFYEVWPAIRAGTATRTPQVRDAGTFHWLRDVYPLDEIDLDAPTTARALLNRLRARTYDDRTYAYFEDGGQRVYVAVDLSLESARRRPSVGKPSPVGRRLAELREARGLTVRDLAERSGVSWQTIADIEDGAFGTPPRETLSAIEDGLGVERRTLSR